MGIRYVFVNAEGHEEVCDEVPLGYKQATNNEMELLACVLALRDLPADLLAPHLQRMIIFTDSQYVRDNYDRAVWTWPKTG